MDNYANLNDYFSTCLWYFICFFEYLYYLDWMQGVWNMFVIWPKFCDDAWLLTVRGFVWFVLGKRANTLLKILQSMLMSLGRIASQMQQKPACQASLLDRIPFIYNVNITVNIWLIYIYCITVSFHGSYYISIIEWHCSLWFQNF